MPNWNIGAVNILLSLFLGVILLLAPQILHTAAFAGANWNDRVVGSIVVTLAIVSVLAYGEWMEWLCLAVGLWIIGSPWIFNFNAARTATVIHLMSGAIVTLLAIVEIRQLHPRRSDVLDRK